jgi:hypothetical protein
MRVGRREDGTRQCSSRTQTVKSAFCYSPAMPAGDSVLTFLQGYPGGRYCAPCLAAASGIADANDVRRVIELPAEYRSGLTVELTECSACHNIRRTLSVSQIRL